jgi:hypothetical protein
MRRIVWAATACVLLAANPAVAAGTAKMSVSFNWCGLSSPATKVSGIPAEAKKLRFKLVDHQATGYPHGGGEFPVSGKSVSVPCGGLKSSSFEGPHPPPPQVHDYEWTVTALDASGGVIGTGSAVRKFP